MRVVSDDALQHLAVGASTDGVGGDEADGLQLSGGDLRAAFLEPVGDEISAARHAAIEAAAQRIDVIVAEPGAHELVAHETAGCRR